MELGAIAGAITAVATMVTAIGGIYLGRRMQGVKVQSDEIHKIVNQQRTDMLQYQKALIAALAAHDIDVPVDQSTLE